MSICLATKGVLCPVPLTPTPPTFSPILGFGVELVLAKPKCVSTTRVVELVTPVLFRVENVVDSLDAPKGFFVEGDIAPSAPSGFNVEDETFVSAPMGFAVEDI